ncbi:MAG: hypothetical protein ABIS92_14845 [Polyangia bacterium]
MNARLILPSLFLLSSLVVLDNCGEKNDTKLNRTGAGAYTIPKVYPPVRAAMPEALINDAAFATTRMAALSTGPEGALATVRGALLQDPVSVASVVRDRLYSPGPTEILRIVNELDGRTAMLDTDPGRHPCLTGAPVTNTLVLEGGESFALSLQCMDRFANGNGWIAFGFDRAMAAPVDGGAAPDAGKDDKPSDAGIHDAPAEVGDFYIAMGSENGMGSAYHVSRTTGKVEGWIVVADSRATSNSQVIMHLLVEGAKFELTFAGSGVGFCAAHLSGDSDHLFIKAKTNAPPPPGTAMSPDVQYCDSERTGCFRTTALETDLGGDASACAEIAADTFRLEVDLDASTDSTGNVIPPHLHTHFATAPAGIPAF